MQFPDSSDFNSKVIEVCKDILSMSKVNDQPAVHVHSRKHHWQTENGN
jgi:hypothetical protein